jgi:hypothetical protein
LLIVTKIVRIYMINCNRNDDVYFRLQWTKVS